MTDWARQLDLEHSRYPLRLDIKKLTIVADTADGPVPMDRMGTVKTGSATTSSGIWLCMNGSPGAIGQYRGFSSWINRPRSTSHRRRTSTARWP